MKERKVKNTLMLLLTALIWGSAFVAQSVGMDYVGPFTFNGVRSVIGGIFLIFCIWFMDKTGIRKNKREESREDKKALLTGGISCGVVLFIASNLQQIGIQYTTVGKAGFITALYIVIVPVMGLFLKKKCPVTVWISVIIAVIGFYRLSVTDGFSLTKGDLLVLLCAVVFSVHILVIDYFTEKADGVKMSCIQFIVCGILSCICMFIFEKPHVAALFGAWMPLLYAGILSCGVAYTLQIVAQKGYNPTVASLLLSLESVFSVVAGFIVLGQKMTARELSGCLLIFAAVILAQIPVGNKEQK